MLNKLYIFFSENSLLSIPSRTISSLKKLETLLVNNNLITTIKTDSFKDLTIQKIEVLFYSLILDFILFQLCHNRIDTIERASFVKLNQLQQLR